MNIFKQSMKKIARKNNNMSKRLKFTKVPRIWKQKQKFKHAFHIVSANKM